MTMTDLPNLPLGQSSETSRPRPEHRLLVGAASVLFLLLLAGLATLPGWLPGRTLAPMDALGMVAPWGSATSGGPSADQEYRLRLLTRALAPWHEAVAQLKQHRIPLWNPHQFLGQPLLGSGQVAPFYPTTLLYALPATWSYTLAATVQLFLAGLGAWRLARFSGLRALGAMLAGSVYMLSGIHLVGLHTNAGLVTPWLPFAVLIVEKLVERVSIWRMILAALIFAAQFLGGDAAGSGAIILTCGLLWGIRLFVPRQTLVESRRPGRMVGAAAAIALALAIGFAIAGVQWAPVIDTWIHTVANPSVGTSHCLPWGVSLGQAGPLAPAFVGTLAVVLACFGLRLGRDRRLVWTWGVLGIGGFAAAVLAPWWPPILHQVADLSFVGAPLVLVMSGLAVALLAGVGLESLLDQVAVEPDFQRLRQGGYIAAGAMAVVIAAWIGGWILYRPAIPWALGGLRVGAVLVILAAAVGLWMRTIRGCRRGPRHIDVGLGDKPIYRVEDAEVTYEPCPLHRLRRLGGGTVALVLIELLAFAIPHNRGSRSWGEFPAAPAIESLQSKVGSFRFAGTPGMLPPNLASAYGMDDLRGVAPRISPRMVAWLDEFRDAGPSARGSTQAVRGADPTSLLSLRYLVAGTSDPTPGGPWKPLGASAAASIFENPDALPRARMVARTQIKKSQGGDTRVLPTPRQVFEQLHAPWNFDPRDEVLVDGQIGDAFALELDAQPEWRDWPDKAGAGLGKGSVEYARPFADEIAVKIRNGGGGWLVISESNLPGWEAAVTDHPAEPRSRSQTRIVPIAPAYSILQAVFVPKGNVEVEMTYRPWGWRYGLFGSAAAVLALLMLVGFGLFASFRPAESPAPVTSRDDATA